MHISEIERVLLVVARSMLLLWSSTLYHLSPALEPPELFSGSLSLNLTLQSETSTKDTCWLTTHREVLSTRLNYCSPLHSENYSLDTIPHLAKCF